jgi:predicted lipoprotein with Yx(FWY)xxD motif
VSIAAVVSASAFAHGTRATAHSSSAAKVELRHTRLGEILANGSGFTLYLFTRDHGAHNSCASIGGCEGAWPALLTSGRPSAGAGVRGSLLSTIKLSGGRTQVTYAGHPLYLYRGDSSPGDTSYIGADAFGGTWDALSASGHAIR